MRSHADRRKRDDVRIAIDAPLPEALSERADEAMYHSKESGRDGVSFFGVDAALVRGDRTTEGTDP